MKLDKFDIAILEALQSDARLSLQDLGKQVGLTASPCWNRVKRLEEAGIIEGALGDLGMQLRHRLVRGLAGRMLIGTDDRGLAYRHLQRPHLA